MLDLKNFSEKELAEIKARYLQQAFVNKVWVTDESLSVDIALYARVIDPRLTMIDGDPSIVAKRRKDGGKFLKMAIPLKGGAILEYPLAHSHTFTEGDVIDASTIIFKTERCLGESSTYITGKIKK